MNIVNRHLNRRTARAIASFCSVRSSAAQGSGVDPECIPTLNAMWAKALHHLRDSCSRGVAKARLDNECYIPHYEDQHILNLLNDAIWRQQLMCNLD